MCRYVYNHKTCGRCGSQINTWDMQARTVYACQTCQPLHLDPANQLTPARASALQVSTSIIGHQLLKSNATNDKSLCYPTGSLRWRKSVH